MFKFNNLIIYIFLFISFASLAEDNLNVITTKLKKGDTFYKVFSDMNINKSDSKLFISSLQRKLDLKRMPTGQELKFYFMNEPQSLIAVAVPLKKNITVLTWKKNDSITSAKISDNLLNDRVNSILNA